MAEQWFTCREAADFLKLSHNTVRKYCQKRILRASRFGTLWKLSGAEVVRYSRLPRLVGNPNFRNQKKKVAK